jgi:hypothetical protein
MWLVDVNEKDDWLVNNIKIIDGKRNIDDFVNESNNLQLIKKLELDDPDKFFVVLGDVLNIKEGYLTNTITVYEDNNSIIEFCYHQDYTNYFEPKLNYFSSIINNTSEIIFGKACFFMVDKTSKKLIDLSLEKLLSFMANMHVFTTCQVRNGDLEEICFPNIKGHIDDIFKEYDFLLMPTTPGTAFSLGTKNKDPLEMYFADIFTVWSNLAGVPAINIPYGKDLAGMPIGLQIHAGPFKEMDMLDFAAFIEISNKSLK